MPQPSAPFPVSKLISELSAPNPKEPNKMPSLKETYEQVLRNHRASLLWYLGQYGVKEQVAFHLGEIERYEKLLRAIEKK
jgi:hypothetical protein